MNPLPDLTAGEWLVAGLVGLFLAYEICSRVAQACLLVEDALQRTCEEQGRQDTDGTPSE